jgi:hypothetical protein
MSSAFTSLVPLTLPSTSHCQDPPSSPQNVCVILVNFPILFQTLSAQLPIFSSLFFPLSFHNHMKTITNQQQTLTIVSFMNSPPLLIQKTTTGRLLNGFFTGIHIGLVGQPIGLPGTFRTAITMGIINPIIDKTTTPTMEHTLVFRYGQTNQLSPL